MTFVLVPGADIVVETTTVIDSQTKHSAEQHSAYSKDQLLNTQRMLNNQISCIKKNLDKVNEMLQLFE